MSKKTEPFEFETAMTRLRAIIAELDASETRLADSVRLYAEGIGLLEKCAKELTAVQAQLKELRKRSDGVFELIDIQE